MRSFLVLFVFITALFMTIMGQDMDPLQDLEKIKEEFRRMTEDMKNLNPDNPVNPLNTPQQPEAKAPPPAPEVVFTGLSPNVFALTPDIFETALLTFQVLAVVFHGSNCTKCTEIIPMVEKVASTLQNIEYAMIATLNVTAFPDLAQQLGAVSLPTITVYQHWKTSGFTVIDPSSPVDDFIATLKRLLTLYCQYVPMMSPHNVMNFIRGNTEVFVVHCPLDIQICQMLVPQLNEVAKELDGENAGIVVVDDKEWGARFWVHGNATMLNDEQAPHISFVEFGRPKFTYTGSLGALDLMHTIVRESGDRQPDEYVVDLSSVEQLEQILENRSVVVVGLFDSSTDQEAHIKLFDVFAFQNRKMCLFARAVNVTALMVHAQIRSLPAIVMFKTFDEERVVYKGDVNTIEFKSWIQAHFIPSMSVFEPMHYPAYVHRAKPIMYMVGDPTQHEVSLIRMGYLAKKWRYDVTFISMNASLYEDFTGYLKIPNEKLPALIFEDTPEYKAVTIKKGEAFLGRLHVLAKGEDIFTDEMLGVIHSYFNGSLLYSVQPSGWKRDEL